MHYNSKYKYLIAYQIKMRYKIIKKRDEASGYDKYKETDEYKQKIKN